MESKTQKSNNLFRESSIAFLGFSIFDMIHIIVASHVLVYAYSQRPIMEMDAASSAVELSFSFLLILYIVSMIRRHKEAARVRRNFSFCHLIASLSVFLPATFLIPEVVHGDWGTVHETTEWVMVIVYAVLAFLSVVLYAVAQLVDERTPGGLEWRIFLIIGSIVFILAAGTGVGVTVMENKFPTWLIVMDCIGKAGPIVPAILTIWRLSRKAESTDLY